MSKYLNVFNTLAEYQAFSASTEYVQPNVALVKETNVLYYDYGDNKPQADLSDYKLEPEETSVGGDKYGNSAITKVNYIPSSTTSLASAFENWSSLKEVTCKIPNSVTNMRSTFKGCSSLVTAPEMPSGVTSLYHTFQGCTSLVNAPVIPSSVSNIKYTFDGCSSLVTAHEIPSGVTNMEYTFNGCSRLVTAPEILSCVTRLDYTFNGCSSLKEVTFLHTTPPSYYHTLSGCSKLESIYVPDEAVDKYKTATGWLEFASKIKPLSSKPSE